jgi:hypothetical protein
VPFQADSDIAIAGGQGAGGNVRIMAIVDTEEEFDWSAPFDRNATGVEHMRRIGELQAVFDRHGIRPVYAVGTPIATSPVAVAALKPILREKRALIGTHLHPWVTPPLIEEVNQRNSYPGNLAKAVEAAKIRTLTGQIEAAFDTRPLIYKAGRYGIGPQSFAILEALGYQVDISPMPPFDYHRHHGPNFSRRGNQLRWEGPGRTVLSIPNTGSFVGWLARPKLEWISDITLSPAARRLHISGILARLGLLERIALSPEGYTLTELRRLVRFCLVRGQRLFMLSLHSPSVAPGYTSYVRDEAEQVAFLAKLDRFLGWFLGEIHGEPGDPLRLYAEMASSGRGPTTSIPAASAAKPAVSVQPIKTADLPELAAYWHANLNPAIPRQTWIEAFQQNWLSDPPNHGFKILAGGKLVGALGAIYSRQDIEGAPVEFCNLTSLVVEDAYRARSMDLLSACLSQKQFRFTNFTPTPSVAKMLRLFRFRELPSGERVVFHAPVPTLVMGLQAIDRPEVLAGALNENAGKLWRDHRPLPWLRCFAVGRGNEWCLVFWHRCLIKGLTGARILGFSDPDLFVRWHWAIGGHLLLRHGAFGMRFEEHLVPEGSEIGVHRPVTMPRLYRGPEMAHRNVSFLYSELVALPI